MENRNCQNCKQNFVIQPDDFSFYEKLGVPAPTWCPECRQMRRMSFRNQRNFYKRKCDKTGEDIISIFPPDSPYKVWSYRQWHSDNFNPMSYGRDYDFSKSFFEQYKQLMLDTPWPSVRIKASENCDYNTDVSRCKDCYLCARIYRANNLLYTYRGNRSMNSVDCFQILESSEFLYECMECIACNNSRFLFMCTNCTESSFLWNCKNCMDCFMSTNLRNKQYVFKNEQLSKEEYKKRMQTLNFGSFKEKENNLKEFDSICKNSIRRYLNIFNSQNVSGDNIFNSKNCLLSFGTRDCENSKYIWDVMNYTDSMDVYSGGDSQIIYEATDIGACYNVKFCYRATHTRDTEYSCMLDTVKSSFGCVGLNNKQFCILNKQYSESEYFELLSKIKNQMKESGEYGEFFPFNLSIFSYNETIAQEYFPLIKDEALNKGVQWKDSGARNYTVTLQPQDIKDDIIDINESITKEVIGCLHSGGDCGHGCTTAFKIIPREFELYKKMNIPIPKLCPNCRYYERMAKNNPWKLWHRSCMCDLTNHDHVGLCEVEFETSYSPDRPEKVYCEKCYQQEVI